MLIACYGSLKEGHYNHRALGEDAKFIGKSSVRGVMYTNGSYPKLYHIGSLANMSWFKTEDARYHAVELYDINENRYRAINSMEVGAGYVPEQHLFEVEGYPQALEATIYFMPHENFNSEDKWVEAY